LVTNNAAVVLLDFLTFHSAGQGSDQTAPRFSIHIPQHDNSKVIYWAEICFVNDYIADGGSNCAV